jgi:UDP-N-acetyl-D-galactosamine dehydrogenase
VFVHDPEADPAEALQEYGVKLQRWEDLPRADAIVAAVAHRQYQALSLEEISRKIVKNGCFADVKAGFDAAALEAAGLAVWRL